MAVVPAVVGAVERGAGARAERGIEMTFGIVLVLLGAIYLAITLELIEGVTVGELWPLLLIAWGLVVIRHSFRRGRRARSWRSSWGSDDE